MPRHQNNQDNKLATVLALAGLAQKQQAQGDDMQAQRVHAAMQMLGLTNEQNRAQAQSEHEAAMLQATQGNYQDEARHRQAADALAKQQADMANWEATDRSTRGYEANANEVAHQRALEHLGITNEIAKAYGTGLPVNPVLANYLGGLDPNLGQAQNTAQQQATADQVAKFTALGVGPDGKPLAKPAQAPGVISPQPPPTIPPDLQNLFQATQQTNPQDIAARASFDQAQQTQQQHIQALKYLQQLGLFNNKPQLADFVGAP